jgi:hypothetical protein
MLIGTEQYRGCQLALYREGERHYFTISVAARNPISLPRTMDHTTVESARTEARAIVDGYHKRPR